MEGSKLKGLRATEARGEGDNQGEEETKDGNGEPKSKSGICVVAWREQQSEDVSYDACNTDSGIKCCVLGREGDELFPSVSFVTRL